METPPRKTGFERPFHPFQVISWILQVFNIIAFYGTTMACLESTSRIASIIIFTFLQLGVIILGYKLCSSNPTDEIIESFKNADKNLANQLEEKNEKFCNFCKSPVHSSSKHCVRCNRCTKKFDHHCKWVNNCVGGTNYKMFIYLITNALMLEIFLLAIGLKLVLTFASDPEAVNSQIIRIYHNGSFFNFFLVIQSVLTMEGLVFSFLLSYLAGLHIFLAYKGMTTYEYIIWKRNKFQISPKDNPENKNNSEQNSKSHKSNFSGSDHGIAIGSRV